MQKKTNTHLPHLVFGLPDEPVPEKLFLVFYPTESGLEKKTLANSTTSTVREVLHQRCKDRGVSLSSLTVKDKHGMDVDLDTTLSQVPHRIIVLGESNFFFFFIARSILGFFFSFFRFFFLLVGVFSFDFLFGVSFGFPCGIDLPISSSLQSR